MSYATIQYFFYEIHYRAGGNWMKEGMQLHYILSERLKKILINTTDQPSLIS